MRSILSTVCSRTAGFVFGALTALMLLPVPPASAAATLTIEPLTWNIIGLDSNNPLVQGPYEFLSGGRVCNTGSDTANHITANYVWDSANPFINVSPRGTSVMTEDFLLPGACRDFYFLIRVTRTPLAYNTTRQFHIAVTADNAPAVSTPTPRELYVEHLISQNRNNALNITGPTSVYVGQVVNYTVNSTTATQGYEQLSSFLDFPNVLFQMLAADVTYSSPPGATNDRVYADACGWDNVIGPTPPTGSYRSCVGPPDYVGGKAGGDLQTVYSVRFLSSGSTAVTETIYDFSGSSYHYNSDVSSEIIEIDTLPPVEHVELHKSCAPTPATPGGTITCEIRYGNSSPTVTLTGVEIREDYDPRTTYVSASPAPDNAPANDHWSIGTLSPGEYGTITVTLNVDAAANDGDFLINRVTLNDDVSAANDAPGDPPGVFSYAEATIPVAENLPGTALLRVTKTGSPDPEVGAGSNVTYTIAWQNAGAATAYSVVLTDTLGDGLTFVSSSVAPATSAAPVYTWNLGNLAPGASGSITITARTDAALTTGTIVDNHVVLQGTTGPGTVDSEGLTATAEEQQFIRGGTSAIANLSITKTDATDPITQSGLERYTVTVTNAGPDVATGVVVTDTLDTATTFTATTGSCTHSSGTLTCTIGDLAVGASTSFTVDVVVSATAPTAGTVSTGPCPAAGVDICNRATVTSTSTDPTPSNNSTSTPTNVTAVSGLCDLTVSKAEVTAEPVAAGTNITYAITVQNLGPNNASDVIIRDELDPNMTYVSDTFPSACTLIPPRTLECHYSSLTVGAGARTRNITVAVSGTAPSASSKTTAPCDGTEDLCNRIVSTTVAGCADTNLANNVDSEPTDVARPSSDLSIAKSDTGFDPMVQGGTITYTVTVSNAAGSATANSVQVVDTLGSNLTYLSSTASGGCVQAPTNTLTCSVGSLTAGASTSFTVSALVSATAPTASTTTAGGSGACPGSGVDVCNSATVSSFSNDPNTANNTVYQPTNITPVSADLSIVKTDTGSDPLMEGGILTYQLSVTNSGPNTANNVVVTDVLDTNEFYLADTAPSGCLQAPSGTLTCTLGSLASGATSSFTISVFVPTGGPTSGSISSGACTGAEDTCNTASVASSTPDPVSSNNTDTEPTDITAAQADLQISKSDTGHDPVARSGELTYTIHVENAGPNDAQDVVVTDVLDPDTTYVSDTFGCVQGPTGTLTCDIGAMLVGQSYDFTVTVQVSAAAPTAGTLQNGACNGTEDLCNTIAVASSTADPVSANNTADEPTNVLPAAADLSITKSDPGSDPVQLGGTLTYSLTVANNGPDTATSVVVTDTLDPDTTYVSNTGGCTHSLGVLTCNLGSIANGASTTFTVTTTVSASAATGGTLSFGVCDGSEDLCNTATVTSAITDTHPEDNSDTEPTDVTPRADLQIVKTGPSSIVPGSDAVYTVTVTNLGPSAAAAVSVADPTPSGLTFVSNAGACTTAYPCALGTIASGGTATITTTYSVPSSYTTPAPVLNTATVSSTTTDPVSGNNTSTSSTTVARQADLRVTKDDGSTVYTPGAALTYTVTVSNFGPSDVAGATVEDTLPAQVGNVAWTCSGSGGGTCPASGTGDLGESVDLPVGGSVTFLVNAGVIAGATVDPLSNTATVTPPSGTTDPVPANDSATDNDSPAPAPASIGNRVWLDEDGDGVQDAGEDGIAGVTVRLYDAAGTTLIATTTTDTDGRYVFTGLAPGSYVVRIAPASMPAGLAANPTYDLDDGTTAPDGETTVTVAAGETVGTADFGYNWVPASDSSNPGPGATGAIGDRVWNDADGDGVQDFGEAGIAGVTVHLHTDDNGDGIYGDAGDNAPRTATTDAAGNYVFDGVPPGSYQIEVDATTLPAGFTTTPSSDPDGDGDNQTAAIQLAPGDVWMRGDFGYVLPGGATIGSSIYVDANADGNRDPGEPGIAGVTITLLDGTGQVVASTTTDANGDYAFPGLPNGNYTVVVTDTAGVLADTSTNTGDPDGGNDRLSTVSVSGADQLTQDFGFAPAGQDTGDGLIGSTVFLDRDLSGGFTAGEGLEGVTVRLYDSTGVTLIATVVTDADGAYWFGGLDATQTYIVRVDTGTLPFGGTGLTNTVDPDGGAAGESTVNLTAFAGGVTTTQDFGYVSAAANTIGGSLWNDLDGDGTLEAAETGRYAGVVVVLRDADGDVVAATTTNGSGAYQFTNLPNGTYSVDVVEDGNVLGGLSKSDGPSPGSDGNSQVDGYSVTVTGGASNTTADFGFFAGGAAVGNFVWADADNDGVQDPGEAGIAGVPVTLTITYPTGDVVTVVTVTGASGEYSFGNLLLDENFDGAGAGEPVYTLSIATPPGYQPSPVGAGGNAALDSNAQSGSVATVTQGVTNTTDNALVSNGVDFGFIPVTDVQIVKVGPGAVTPGSNLVYTIVVTNNGPSDALGVVVNDLTPSGLTFVSNAGDCTTAFPCFLGTIAAGDSRTITATFSVPGAYTTPDPIVNTATVFTTTVDTVPANDSSTASTNISFVQADLAIVKTGPVSATPGTNIVYTLVVTNNGPASAASVTVTDPTPGGLVFVSNTGACTSAFPCSLGTLANGATATITATYAIPEGYSALHVDNTAIVSSADADPVPANDSDTETTPVTPSADLEIVKTAPASLTPGLNGVYTITVTNHGPSTAAAVTVADPTPAGLAFVSNAGDCTSSYPCSLGSLASGETRTITTAFAVPASYAGPNPVVNTATVSSTTADPVPGNNSDSASAPVVASADVSLTKSGPGAVTPGTNVVYTILVTNSGPSDAAAVTVTDPTPSGLTFVSNTGACATAFPCSLGTLEAGGTRSITATYSVPAAYTTPDPIVNTATAAASTPDPNGANNSDTATTAISLVQADLAVTKTGPATATPGSTVSYTIVVTNAGPATATNVTATDPTPTGLTFVSNTGDCVTAFPCDLGSIASGGTRTITTTYSMPASYSGANPVSNTVVVASDQADPIPGDNTDTETTPVVRSADVSVLKTGPATAGPGTTIVFTVAVTNSGPSDAANVAVADPTPTGLVFVSNSGACATAYPCNLGTLAAGQTRTITSTYSVPLVYVGAIPIVNTATVTSSTPDPDPSDNSSSASVDFTSVDLDVTKSDTGVSVNRGDNFTYTITVSNNGPSAATGVTVVDVLDSSTTYVSDSAGCTQAPAGTLTCPVGSLAAGSSASFFLTVRVSPSAPFAGTRENGVCDGTEDLCNVVTVTGDQGDPNPSDNTDNEPTDVTTVDLSVLKSDSGTGVHRLQDMAYTIVVTNDGPAAATNVTVTDTLDPATTYVSDTIGCTQSPVGFLTCPVGTLAPGASTSFGVVVQVSATAPTSGARETGNCNAGSDLCNRVTVSSVQADSDASNNSDDEPTNVIASSATADLAITKTDLTGQVQAGGFSTYEISVTNLGTGLARDAVVVDTLDANMDFIASTQGCVEGGGNTLSCPLGDLAAGATVTFQVTVHVDPSAPTAGTFSGSGCPGTGDLCNRANVSSTAVDPTPGNNVAEVSTDVIPATVVSELSLTKSDISPEPVQPGTDVTYQIVVTNNGTSDADDVVVHETLDPYMTHVSDTAGCTVNLHTTGTELECPLGTIPTGASVTMQVVVTIAADAPFNATAQDGDCNDAEDVCNTATVSSSSADSSILDNADSEPTDVSASPTCNNGIVDGAETCDPISGEICNNGVDDDGDGAVDCSDPSCVAPGFQSCDGNCQLTPVCLPILDDPASIRWNSLHMHGRFNPLTPADPFTEGFRFVLSNEFGEIYTATILPGDMRVRTRKNLSKWVWKDPEAKKGRGLRDGIFRLGIHQRVDKETGEMSYITSITAYGDMSRATVPEMTTHLYIGDDVAFLTVTWDGKPGAWNLSLKDAIAAAAPYRR